jgi:hypothetical protein
MKSNSISPLVKKAQKLLKLKNRVITKELVNYIVNIKKGHIINDKWKYKGSHTAFYVVCKNKHTWKTNWNIISQNKWCPECGGNRVSEKYVKKFIREKGGKLDKNFKYINANTKFWITCEKRHRWTTNWSHIKQNHWCHICFGMVKDDNDVKKFINEKGGILNKRWKYRGILHKFSIKCSKGHKFKTCLSYVRSGFWCPYCKTFKTENELRETIEKLLKIKFPKSRPSWLRLGTYTLLELDGYNKRRKIAFEYQGEQHYKFAKFFKHDEKYLKKLQKRDRIKKKLCKENGVSLIVVPYWVKKDKWVSLIKRKVALIENSK